MTLWWAWLALAAARVTGDALPDDPPVPVTPDYAPYITDLTLPLPPPRLVFDGLPEELVAGREAAIAWRAGPGTISTEVLATAVGPTCGGRRLTGETVTILPTCRRSGGALTWTPPDLDTIAVTIKIKTYGLDGEVKDWITREVPYRAAEMAQRRADGIYVWLSRDDGQRLFYQRDGQLRMYTLCSGSETGDVLPDDEHPDEPHDHYGVYHVFAKDVDHYSSLNPEWRMRYAMHYLNGHAVHATSPQFYGELGEPASHGCIRLHLTEAMELFALCPIGTRVEVF